MESTVLSEVDWYRDHDAMARGEPGIRHSYIASLATAINYMTGDLDPVHLMGASAFAFRIWINQTFCPSAVNIFDWDRILPEAVEQCGRHCRHIARYWHEPAVERDRREEAHRAIIHALNIGTPVVCWDVRDGEWGVLIGYDDRDRAYHALDHSGERCELPYDHLGRNGIDIMSVIIPGEPNERSTADVVRSSLRAALAHADQEEPLDRADYQDGLPAYDLWATLCERWAMILDAGSIERVEMDLPALARLYASHYASARVYARDYLVRLANDNPGLEFVAQQYGQVADLLSAVAQYFAEGTMPTNTDSLREVAEIIRSAAKAEKRGLAALRTSLSP